MTDRLMGCSWAALLRMHQGAPTAAAFVAMTGSHARPQPLPCRQQTAGQLPLRVPTYRYTHIYQHTE